MRCCLMYIDAASVPGLPKELAALGIPQVADISSPPSLPPSYGGLSTGGVAEGKSVTGSKDSSSVVAGNVAGGEGKEVLVIRSPAFYT